MFVVFFTLFTTEPVAADDNAPKYILALGDSLTAGYLLEPEEAFPV